MSTKVRRGQARMLALALAWLFLGKGQAAVRIEKQAYHEWAEAFVMSNGQVEAIIVPAVGRVMQFRFQGEDAGPFWENRSLDGKSPNPQSSEWINFGGDKTWPSPQGDWAKITSRGWPPPKAFDSMPVEARIEGEKLVLQSKTDPDYGIQTERRISLSTGGTEMEIETLYRKIQGEPVRVGIWVITQLQDPAEMYMPIPERSLYAEGYNKQSEVLPAKLQFKNRIVTCARSTTHSTKIGSDASDLIWGGERWVLRIHAERETNGEFPDQGSSAEIYTNPDPNKYVELELLGPMQRMSKGSSISRRQTYQLLRRTNQSLAEQVQDLLKATRD